MTIKMPELYRVFTLKKLRKNAIIRQGNHFYRVVDTAFLRIYIVEVYKPRDYLNKKPEGSLHGLMWDNSTNVDGLFADA